MPLQLDQFDLKPPESLLVALGLGFIVLGFLAHLSNSLKFRCVAPSGCLDDDVMQDIAGMRQMISGVGQVTINLTPFQRLHDKGQPLDDRGACRLIHRLQQ